MGQLRELSRGYPIDPLSGDLGSFDSRLMKFEEPIQALISPYTHEPYPDYLYPKLNELREVFLKWQEALLDNLEAGERRSYLMDEQHDKNRQVVEGYLRYGFRFDEIAERVGYSSGSLRNRFKRSDHHRPIEPIAVDGHKDTQSQKPIAKMSQVAQQIGQRPHPRQYGRTITNLLLKRKWSYGKTITSDYLDGPISTP